MRRSTLARLLAHALFLAATPVAAQTRQLYATSKTARVHFDRASVRADEGFVHYRVRIDYGEPRDSRDRRVRYKSSVTLYDDAGKCLARSTRSPERWRRARARPRRPHAPR